MDELEKRRAESDRRFEELRNYLTGGNSIIEAKIIDEEACVYATGSFGRREAGVYSDLDVFIVGKSDGVTNSDGVQGSLLRPLDEILVKAQLIRATRALKFPEFSGDGRYLTHYSTHQLTRTLGRPEDDVTNTLTARLLLLLESRPIIGEKVYNDVLTEVIRAYWRDYEDHKDKFMPAFLTNDILRLWRTFCVNYEAKTETEPEREKAKRKLANYKLKHSRLLTCYSGILYLLAVFRRDRTVTPEHAIEMARLTPTGRLEWLLKEPDFSDARGVIESILCQYSIFLDSTNKPKEEQIFMFSNRSSSFRYLNQANEFGDLVFKALNLVGKDSLFHRLLVV